MCGINGILYFNSFNSDKQVDFFESNISKMNTEIAHRGPDGEGMFINYPVCFGHRRLSIIDLSENGAQPMFNEDSSVVIIFNGEIYNYKELIPGLKSKGHIFKTKSDTEVIIKSYEEYGTDCVSKFNGMWAFAIYDFKKNLFFASRDRFGVKPFYYYKDRDCFIFSSEIKAILKIKNITEGNHGKIFDYLAYGYKTNNGDTFFKDIYELKPSHNVLIHDENIQFKKYWDFSDDKLSRNSNNYLNDIDSLIIDSVKLRFRSDVPVSILLSGGLDSSIIAKITDDLITNNEISSPSVTAYSAVFPFFLFDESETIKEFLKSCNHINSVFLTPGADNLIASIDKFVYGMGEPVFSPTSFAHYTLMQKISENGVKVVLNGQGADEAWCGYGRYIMGYYLLDILFSNPSDFLNQFRMISDKMKYSYKMILLQTIKSIISRKNISYFRSKYQEKIYDCLSKDLTENNSSYFKNSDYKKLSSGNLEGYLKFNLQYQGFNQILHYEDHSAMQSSVEIRSPFVDYRVIEYAFSLPTKFKFDNGITKKILREVFKDRLPDSIISNNQKIGFNTPFDDWLMQDNINTYLNSLINSESFNSKKIWDSGKIRYYFKNKDKFKGFPFWRIINLELWSNAYGIKNL